MTDKMREEKIVRLLRSFISWCPPDMEKTLGEAADIIEQAAQAVPVVGEVVNWGAFPSYLLDHKEGEMVTEENIQFWLAAMIKDPQYNKPTHSISAADLEWLRKDAERGRLLIERGEWLRFDHDTPDAHALLAVRLPYNVDLSCKPTREDAIDAAIAAEGEKE